MGRSLVAAAGHGQAGEPAIATSLRATSLSLNKRGLGWVFARRSEAKPPSLSRAPMTVVAEGEERFAGAIDHGAVLRRGFAFQTREATIALIRAAYAAHQAAIGTTSPPGT